MGNSILPCPFWDELVAEHRTWLSPFHAQYLRNWEKVLNGDYEAGLCEAAVRRLLQKHAIALQPNEELTGLERRLDYRCTHAEGTFFVEVACIPIDKATEETGLPYPSQPGARNFRHLNDAIFKKCLKKNPQSSGTDAPTLLAVGTFHYHASVLCMGRIFVNMLLTGETYASWNVDTKTGHGVGDPFQTTRLYSAPFLQPKGQSIREARTSLSGLLLCGFGCDPPKILGILHPLADWPFDRRMLPDIAFGEVRVDHATGRLFTSWSGANNE